MDKVKIALLSGADKNAGDFLITDRALALLGHVLPNASIEVYKRNFSLKPFLNKINNNDFVVFAGGPGYLENAYPDKFPLTENLNDLKPCFFALGMGGYTEGGSIDGYTFSRNTQILFDRFERDGFGFGCRDRISERLLNAAGYRDTIFTGCPAWYDLRVLEAEKEQGTAIYSIPSTINHIAISDPAISRNFSVAKMLVQYLNDKFHPKKITFVFHRGWKKDQFSDANLAKLQTDFLNSLKLANVTPVDISYSSEGFSVYNEADIHVGFRVHAHIYTMSQRKPSFLIEEDGRGFGVDDALGLNHIGPLVVPAPMRVVNRFSRKLVGKEASYSSTAAQKVIGRLDSIIDDEIKKDFIKTRAAFDVMAQTYELMQGHIKRMMTK